MEDNEFKTECGTFDFLKILNFITKDKFDLTHGLGQTSVLRNCDLPTMFIAEVYIPTIPKSIEQKIAGEANALTALIREIFRVKGCL